MSTQDAQYEILSSADLLSRMMKLARDYPTFVTLTTTQEWFGLPRAGSASDCPFDRQYKDEDNDGCNNYVLILQDKEAYPDDPDVKIAPNAEFLSNLEGGFWKEPAEGAEANTPPAKSGWKYIPDVFLSGSVHGDERVGPTSLIEMAELLAHSAYCESLPRMKYQPKTSSQPVDTEHDQSANLWKQELMSGMMCRQSLEDKGVPAPYRQWLARLTSTRRIVIIPTANALGYSQNTREENHIDPNRDFPFDIERGNEASCMQTVAGRSINELFRSHLFPIGLTFHGGMEVIGYEWGAPTYLNKNAPDALAQQTIASAYSRYANAFQNHRAYDYGTMNDKVYYVRGGMEDWAFAGSWDPERVVQCTPTTYGGYDAEKTQYNNATLRAFNMLVETSDIKGPPSSELGNRKSPLISSNGSENGHIARNIRLALVAVDAVEPYVAIRGVEGIKFDDDLVPAVNQRAYDGGTFLETTKQVWVAESEGRRNLQGRQTEKTTTATVSWTVGGAFDIDATEVVYGPWDKLPGSLADGVDGFYPSAKTLQLLSSDFVTTSPSNIDSSSEEQGRTMWHQEGAFPVVDENKPFPTFEASLDLSKYPSGTTIAVFAKAKVDKAWMTQADNVGPDNIGSTSHIVNARTNPDYFVTNAGKVIQGRKDSWWYSTPIAITIGSVEDQTDLIKHANASHAPMSFIDGLVRAIHTNSRMGSMNMEGSMMGGMNMEGSPMENVDNSPEVKTERSIPEERGSNSSMGAVIPSGLSMPWLLGSLASFSILLIGFLIIRRRRRQAHRNYMRRIRDEEEDDFNIDISEREGYRDDEPGLEDSGFGTHEEFTIE